jgi:esterase/lipase
MNKETRRLGEGEAPGPIALRWWPAAAAPPVAFGALWLWLGAQGGLAGMLVGVVPGVLLLSTGLSNLLWAGDSRIFQFMAVGALSGVALSVPGLLVFGTLAGLGLLVGSGLCFLAAGYLSVGQEPLPPGVPEPEMSARLAARAASDEVSMCVIVLTTWPLAVGSQATRIRRETYEALSLFEDKGWIEDPASYHQDPPPLEKVERESGSIPGLEFERVRFPSLYEPHKEEPGRDRWLSYEHNRTAHAWLLRHPGAPRPWLVCLHGIRMGSPKRDIPHFQPEYLHHELGLNLMIPALPIHGPRRVGPVSGDRILSGDVMDALHAGAQAMWDVRRLISWLRETQEAPSVGALGHSLGGYAAALLAGLGDVDCVVAANPATDSSRLFWQNALSLVTRYLKAEGIREEDSARLLRVVSPLAFAPLVPKERLAIFHGIADRVVPAVEAASLWEHWGRPRIAWYGGTHRDFLRAPEARALFEETLSAAGMLRQPR